MAGIISTTLSASSVYDVDFINWNGDGSPEGLASFTFGNRTKKTTGVIKAANRFIKILFTRLGSDPFNKTLGTNIEDVSYMDATRTSAIATFIVSQLNAALSQLKSIQSESKPPEDETLASVTLTGIDIINYKPIVRFRLLTNSGTNVTVKVPVIGG